MSLQPVLQQVGNLLLDVLREALVPAVLHAGDDIQIAYPTAEQDYQVGVFLHDIEEIRPYGTALPVRISDTQKQGPSRTFALHFLVYANRRMAFQSMTALDELILMEAVIRTIHNSASTLLEGKKLNLQLDALSRQEKVALWQSISSPLQPAVYLLMEPLVIPSTKLEHFVPVREMVLKSRKKKEENEH